MNDERSLKIGAAVQSLAADWAVLTSIDTVCYATGFEVGIEAGPSPFAGGPATAFVARDGTTGLIVTNLELPAAEASRADLVRGYEGFGSERQAPYAANYLAAVANLVSELGVGGVVAVEQRTCPSLLRAALDDAASRFVLIDDELDRARSVKTAAEIDQLRRCAALTALGQAAALEAVRVGRAELEAFADIRRAMEVEAGHRLPITGDLLSGVERTAQSMGWPIARTFEEGDPVICDLAPRLGGYWGDSCNTLFLGEPPPAFLRLYETSRRALERAAEILRPGITAGDVDAEVRGVIEAAGLRDLLHVGHGIGTSSHEYPRLVREESCRLEPGMVLMVEPGAYDAAIGGVRLEWMFLVTEQANEVLSPFQHVLSRAATPAPGG